MAHPMQAVSPTTARDCKRPELGRRGTEQSDGWLDSEQPGGLTLPDTRPAAAAPAVRCSPAQRYARSVRVAPAPDREPARSSAVHAAHAAHGAHAAYVAPVAPVAPVAHVAHVALAPAAHPGPAEPEPSAAPRRRLSTRKVCLCGTGLLLLGAGLAWGGAAVVGAALMRHLQRRSTDAPTEGPRGVSTDAIGHDAAPPSTSREDRDPPSALTQALLAGASRDLALTREIETLLSQASPQAGLQALVTRLAGGPRRMVTLQTVDRLVDAYRASRHWRRHDAMRDFLAGMIRAIRPGDMSGAHLEHLLRVWSWHYGELADERNAPDGFHPTTLTWAIPSTVAEGLGGPLISHTHLGLLIGAVSRPPEGLPREDLDEVTLMRHAEHVAAAIGYVITVTMPLHPRSAGHTGVAAQIDVPHGEACLRMLKAQIVGEPRWYAAVFAALSGQTLDAVSAHASVALPLS